MATSRKKLGELLLEAKALDPMQLQSALGHQRQWGGRLGRVLVDLGFVRESTIVEVLATQLKIPVVRLMDVPADERAMKLIPANTAQQLNVFPVRLEGPERSGTLHVAIADPTDLSLIDQVQFQTRRRIQPLITSIRDIESAISRHYFNDESIPPPDYDTSPVENEDEFDLIAGDSTQVPGLVSFGTSETLPSSDEDEDKTEQVVIQPLSGDHPELAPSGMEVEVGDSTSPTVVSSDVPVESWDHEPVELSTEAEAIEAEAVDTTPPAPKHGSARTGGVGARVRPAPPPIAPPVMQVIMPPGSRPSAFQSAPQESDPQHSSEGYDPAQGSPSAGGSELDPFAEIEPAHPEALDGADPSAAYPQGQAGSSSISSQESLDAWGEPPGVEGDSPFSEADSWNSEEQVDEPVDALAEGWLVPADDGASDGAANEGAGGVSETDGWDVSADVEADLTPVSESDDEWLTPADSSDEPGAEGVDLAAASSPAPDFDSDEPASASGAAEDSEWSTPIESDFAGDSDLQVDDEWGVDPESDGSHWEAPAESPEFDAFQPAEAGATDTDTGFEGYEGYDVHEESDGSNLPSVPDVPAPADVSEGDGSFGYSDSYEGFEVSEDVEEADAFEVAEEVPGDVVEDLTASDSFDSVYDVTEDATEEAEAAADVEAGAEVADGDDFSDGSELAEDVSDDAFDGSEASASADDYWAPAEADDGGWDVPDVSAVEEVESFDTVEAADPAEVHAAVDVGDGAAEFDTFDSSDTFEVSDSVDVDVTESVGESEAASDPHQAYGESQDDGSYSEPQDSDAYSESEDSDSQGDDSYDDGPDWLAPPVDDDLVVSGDDAAADWAEVEVTEGDFADDAATSHDVDPDEPAQHEVDEPALDQYEVDTPLAANWSQESESEYQAASGAESHDEIGSLEEFDSQYGFEPRQDEGSDPSPDSGEATESDGASPALDWSDVSYADDGESAAVDMEQAGFDSPAASSDAEVTDAPDFAESDVADAGSDDVTNVPVATDPVDVAHSPEFTDVTDEADSADLTGASDSADAPGIAVRDLREVVDSIDTSSVHDTTTHDDSPFDEASSPDVTSSRDEASSFDGDAAAWATGTGADEEWAGAEVTEPQPADLPRGQEAAGDEWDAFSPAGELDDQVPDQPEERLEEVAAGEGGERSGGGAPGSTDLTSAGSFTGAAYDWAQGPAVEGDEGGEVFAEFAPADEFGGSEVFGSSAPDDVAQDPSLELQDDFAGDVEKGSAREGDDAANGSISAEAAESAEESTPSASREPASGEAAVFETSYGESEVPTDTESWPVDESADTPEPSRVMDAHAAWSLLGIPEPTAGDAARVVGSLVNLLIQRGVVDPADLKAALANAPSEPSLEDEEAGRPRDEETESA